MRRRLMRAVDRNEPSLLFARRIPMAALIQTLAVAEYLNFRHAANALGIAQSSVSARVKALEDELGILLFERHARGVRLTEAGRHFIEEVANGVDQLDQAVKTAGMIARGEYGRLRVGVHALIPGGFLANLIGRYHKQHPCIDMEITDGTARETITQLRTGRLDVTFVANSADIPDCHSRSIWTERLLAALPSSHPLAGRTGVAWLDLASETFLVRRGGIGSQVHDHIVSRLAGRSPNLSILRLDIERDTLLSMISQDYGITIVGEAAALIHPPGVTFLPVLDEPAPMAFSAVWSPHNRDPALKSLLDLASEMSGLA